MTTLESYRQFADHFLTNCTKQAKPDNLLLVWYWVKAIRRWEASEPERMPREVVQAFEGLDLTCFFHGYRLSLKELIAFPAGNEKE